MHETRMEARALKDRWPISEDHRQEIIDRMLEIVRDPQASNREKTAAAKALMDADKVNVDSTAADKMPDHSRDGDREHREALKIIEELSQARPVNSRPPSEN